MNKKISVIIPVYNAMTSGGGYVTRCIDSVLNQKNFNIEDIEIIIINDGSKDNSLEVIQEIADKNPSVIRLIDQENMGVAKTRNKALQLVTGEYTTYLDQDDWIDEDFCATMYGAAKTEDYDVVIGGYRRPNSHGQITRTFMPKKTSYARYTISAAWAKIHRTEFLRANMIDFFANSYGEDMPFTVKENLNTTHYKIIDYIGYNWFFNDKSVSNTSQKSLSVENIKSFKTLLSYLKTIDGASSSSECEYYMLRTTIYYLLFSGKNASSNLFADTQKELFSLLPNIDVQTPQGESLTVAVIVKTFGIIVKLGLIGIFARIWCRG